MKLYKAVNLKTIKASFNLTTGHARSINAKKNIIVSFLIKGGSIITTLAVVPLTINFTSPERYGVWLTLGSIIAWFSFFDIGFGNGLRYKFAEALAKDDVKLAKSYVSTTYAVLSTIVVFVWGVLVSINTCINWHTILNVDVSIEEELKRAIFFIITFFSVQFVLKLICTLLTAIQKPAKGAFLYFFADILSLVTIFILTKIHTEGSLISLALITGSSSTIVLTIASVWFFFQDFKSYKPNICFVRFRHIKSLMGIGVKFFIIQIAAVFIFQCTNIIVIRILGPDQVTVYNVCYRYFSIPIMITGIITAPLWGAFTESYIKKDYTWMENTQKKLLTFWHCSIVLLLIMFLISKIAFRVWIGDSVSIGWYVSIAMMLNVVVAVRYNLFVGIIAGLGKLKLTLTLTIIFSFLYIPLAVLLGKSYGLSGVIITNLLINLVYSIFLPIQSNRIIKQTATGIWIT